MKNLKVWGGRYIWKGRSERLLIAAYSQKQASEISKISLSEIQNYFSVTGNEWELENMTSVGVMLVLNAYTNSRSILFKKERLDGTED